MRHRIMVRSERESTNEIARFGVLKLPIPAISNASESEKQTPAQSLRGLFTDDQIVLEIEIDSVFGRHEQQNVRQQNRPEMDNASPVIYAECAVDEIERYREAYPDQNLSRKLNRRIVLGNMAI